MAVALDRSRPPVKSRAMAQGTTAEIGLGERVGTRGERWVPVSHVQRLVIAAFLAALAYWLLTAGVRSYCPTTAPDVGATQCVTLTLSPSPFLLVAVAAAVLIALGRASSRVDISRMLDRAAGGIIVCALAAAAVAQTWFWLIPIERFYSGSFEFFVPFPTRRWPRR